MGTSDKSIRWIENLADQERLIGEGEKTSVDISATKEEVLAGETARFSHELLGHFEYLSKLFNQRVQNESSRIKLVRNSDDSPGFSLIRNKRKMTLGTPSAGKLQLNCVKVVDQGPNMAPKTTVMFSGAIEAKFGTFHDVDWYFLGNAVLSEQVARHYLTEFIQASRTPSESN